MRARAQNKPETYNGWPWPVIWSGEVKLVAAQENNHKVNNQHWANYEE